MAPISKKHLIYLASTSFLGYCIYNYSAPSITRYLTYDNQQEIPPNYCRNNENKDKDQDIFISVLSDTKSKVESIIESETYINDLKRLRQINKESEDETNKELINKIAKIVNKIDPNLNYDDFIFAKTMQLFLTHNAESFDNNELDKIIKEYIVHNKDNKIISYSNIITGEILNYLASK